MQAHARRSIGNSSEGDRTRAGVAAPPTGTAIRQVQTGRQSGAAQGCLNILISSTRPVREFHPLGGDGKWTCLGRLGLTDHFPNASHLADLERADRFRDLERHLEAGVQGEGARGLQEHTRFTDVYGEATLPIIGAPRLDTARGFPCCTAWHEWDVSH